ncbi:hypothetical protein SAMN05192558_10297 [Actinokineospora alba]|uniref:HprK-related kinase B n=1 Tax=Actinokineospora alba TaxID=504798 RepID=A0A1H0HGF4_9PSEU|nr:hypothetical protein [Actinokineospora alba]TDP64905.1 hypothetical protein C8E96_0382 [Actinokineospora alba]SDH48928.1 hypothetical protein SAMN05421871_101206 [Actinokineospora alba]SDO17921.1 hypothetical protein SAMN05192558_10297 [Actinokineospora alba]
MTAHTETGTGPITTGPITTGPITTGPITTGPITMRFGSGQGIVDVHSDTATVADLAELTAPFFTQETLARPTGDAPSVWVVDNLPDGDSWTRLVFTSDFEPDRELWVDHERRRVAVVAPRSGWRTQQALRCARNLIRWQAYSRGELFVHGGLVALGGTGIAFLGHKRAGKTTSILSSLVHAGAAFVSNDDLVLAATDDGPTVGYGYPRTVNVRTDSLLALTGTRPELARLLDDVSHPANSYPGKQLDEVIGTTDEGKAIPESLWVRCAELARATGAELVPTHRVHAVVFPRFVAEGEPVGVEVLDRAAAEAALREHIEPRAVDFDPFLAQWYPRDAADVRAATIEHLLDTAKFLRLHQNLGRLPEATAALAAELGRTGTGER